VVYSPKLNNSLTITPTIAPLSSVQRPLEEVCSGDLIRGQKAQAPGKARRMSWEVLRLPGQALHSISRGRGAGKEFLNDCPCKPEGGNC
jgi:hypothetical protein